MSSSILNVLMICHSPSSSVLNWYLIIRKTVEREVERIWRHLRPDEPLTTHSLRPIGSGTFALNFVDEVSKPWRRVLRCISYITVQLQKKRRMNKSKRNENHNIDLRRFSKQGSKSKASN